MVAPGSRQGLLSRVVPVANDIFNREFDRMHWHDLNGASYRGLYTSGGCKAIPGYAKIMLKGIADCCCCKRQPCVQNLAKGLNGMQASHYGPWCAVLTVGTQHGMLKMRLCRNRPDVFHSILPYETVFRKGKKKQ